MLQKDFEQILQLINLNEFILSFRGGLSHMAGQDVGPFLCFTALTPVPLGPGLGNCLWQPAFW